MYELDNSHIPCAIFLDLSKAFDTLNYKILLRKLKYYGLGNVAYNLIENYLTNRQQFVKCEIKVNANPYRSSPRFDFGAFVV